VHYFTYLYTDAIVSLAVACGLSPDLLIEMTAGTANHSFIMGASSKNGDIVVRDRNDMGVEIRMMTGI
jgi:hypothetical protein